MSDCFVCKKALSLSEIIVVKEKGVQTLLKSANLRQDKDNENILKNKTSVSLHRTCYKNYSNLKLADVARAISCAFRDHAKKKYIGAGVTLHMLDADQEYRKLAAEEFNMLTPGNEMKIDATEPNRGQFNFASGDELVAFAEKSNMRVRGHTLVWHSQVPGWLSRLTGSDLLSAMNNHIKNVAGRWKGKIYAWDVCNEVLNEDGSLRNSFWLSAGNNYIETAFRTAHATDPNAKLYINDYNVEGINAKSTGLYNLVKKMLAEGVPVHGVGIQSHFTLGSIPSDYEANLKRFSDLGVDVAVTELDIGMGNQNEDAQAKAYAKAITACANVARCVGVTIWGITDSDSWRKNESPLPWANNYRVKPAVQAIENALV